MSDPTSLLQQQLQLLEQDVAHVIGKKAISKTNAKRKRKRQKKAKKKKSEIYQVESEKVKRKKNYAENIKRLTVEANPDLSVDFVKKVSAKECSREYFCFMLQ